MIPISEIQKNYGNSMAVLIQCCRIHFKTAEIGDLNSFIKENNIEWSDVFKTCRKHHISTLIYKILLKANLNNPTVQQKISNLSNIFTLQSFEQAKETERLIYLFKENNITLIPYKGTAFSKQFFGNISMRQSSDIDFIIDSDAIPMAIKIMENEGFIPYQKEYYKWIGHNNFIKKHKDFSFDKYVGNDRLFHIELHFNIINKTTHLATLKNNFDLSEKTELKLFLKEIDCLNPVSHFKAVALHHMLMDHMGYLKTVIDITQMLIQISDLVASNKINIDEKDIINQLNKNYKLDLIHDLMYTLFGVSVKNNKLQLIKNPLTKRILNSSYRKVRENKNPLFDTLNFNYNQLKNTVIFYKKRKDKIAYILKSIISISHPQPEDYMTVQLNKNIYFLYYFIRPFRLLFFPGDPNKKCLNLK
ncbi:nucleotidyltransferase family protein [Flavobacterium flavipallidum]|uniref:Nucleotidyltransferase family protein n=1 Tax=Flavobacterium flavipallidum TaxID=3139140 RepID=A0ABU9HID4_9FLAO